MAKTKVLVEIEADGLTPEQVLSYVEEALVLVRDLNEDRAIDGEESVQIDGHEVKLA